MDTLLSFKGDQTRLVVETIVSHLEDLSDRLTPPSHRSHMGRLTEHLLQPLWAILGWQTDRQEDDEIRLARNSTLWALGSIAENQDIRHQLKGKLEEYFSDPATLDPTIVNTAIRLGARVGNPQRFTDYQNRLKKAKTPEDRDRYLIALTDFPSVDLSKQLMEMTLTDVVRGQDLWRPYRTLFSNPVHQEMTWDFVKKHWQELKEKTGPIGAQRIIQSTKSLWKKEWYDEVSSFFKHPTNHVESADKALDQTLEFIKLGITFKSSQQEAFIKWMVQFNEKIG